MMGDGFNRPLSSRTGSSRSVSSGRASSDRSRSAVCSPRARPPRHCETCWERARQCRCVRVPAQGHRRPALPPAALAVEKDRPVEPGRTFDESMHVGFVDADHVRGGVDRCRARMAAVAITTSPIQLGRNTAIFMEPSLPLAASRSRGERIERPSRKRASAKPQAASGRRILLDQTRRRKPFAQRPVQTHARHTTRRTSLRSRPPPDNRPP